jgi:hypothetical protein
VGCLKGGDHHGLSKGEVLGRNSPLNGRPPLSLVEDEMGSEREEEVTERVVGTCKIEDVYKHQHGETGQL